MHFIRKSTAGRLALSVFTCAALTVAGTAVLAQQVIFVDIDAGGAADGTSWADAYPSLQDALAEAASGDEIWVAQGVYYPDDGEGVTPNDVEATFAVPGGVSVFGGFGGTEQNREDRDWETNVTVLSGDLMQNDSGEIAENESTRQNNAEVIVTIEDPSERVVIDGLHVVDALGRGIRHIRGELSLQNIQFERNSDGGLLTSIGILVGANLTFVSNNAHSGGGMLVSSPAVLNDLFFQENTAELEGGALWIDAPTLIADARFIDNLAPLGGAALNRSEVYLANAQFLGNDSYSCGGAFESREGSRSVIVNSVFSGNQALMTPDNIYDGGGALCSFSAEVDVVNSVFYANHTNRDGGAAYVAPEIQATSLHVHNSIFRQNTADGREDDIFTRNDGLLAVGHSIFESALPDSTEDLGGNLFTDPLFVNPLGDDGVAGTSDDDFRLMAGSPAIDAGSNSALPVDWLDLDGDADTTDAFPVDIAGLLRIFAATGEEARVDIGAHEFGAPPLGLAIENPAEGGGRPPTFEIYPNPADREARLRVDLAESSALTISVYDLKGRRITKNRSGFAASGSHDLTIDTRELANGIYFVVVEHSGGQLAEPLLVIH